MNRAKRISICAFVLFCALLAGGPLCPRSVHAGGAELAWNITYQALSGPDTSGYTFYLDLLEGPISESRFTLSVCMGWVDYKIDSDKYYEGGDGSFIGWHFRMYPGGEPMRGFYAGFGIRRWSLVWNYRDGFRRGVGDRSVFEASIMVGGKVRLGNGSLFFEPSLQAGRFLHSGNPQLESYYAAGLGFGFAF